MTTEPSDANATANAATDAPDPNALFLSSPAAGAPHPESGPRKSQVFTRGRPFEPGNPGRPLGARNRTTVMLEQMFEGEAGEVARKAVELAKEGCYGPIKLIIDRTYPK